MKDESVKKCFECTQRPRFEDKLYCAECLDKPKRPFSLGSHPNIGNFYDKV